VICAKLRVLFRTNDLSKVDMRSKKKRKRKDYQKQ